MGRLLVVYDFLSHGAGDVFTVDSYSGIGGQMQYDNIPVYTATKVDPDQTEPTGSFELRDSYDFRPTVEDIAGASATLSVVDQITSSSFDFANRQFDGTGASTVNFPKPASNLQCDFEYYIPYRATLFMTSKGEFRIFYGTSSDDPLPPKDIQDGLKLATMFIPAFTFSPDQVEVNRYKTQRFTMRDIGKLKNRIEKLEDVTSLTLLENQAQAFEIQDQNGLNRFKSGFIVDNFTGHTVAAAQNKDYKAAVDIQKRELRPKCVMRNIDLIESVSTDAARAAAGYQRTGDLITLPYTEEAFINQPYGTRVENVQPYMTSQWVGRIELKPSGDEWFETEIAPTVTKNVDGNYDTVLANNENSLGTFWNAWEVFGVGSSTENLGQEWVTTTSGSTGQQQDLVKSTREVVKTTKVRTGIETTITEDVVFTSGKSKSTALLPFIRPRNVVFDGQCFMPNVRVYAFFDGVDVNAFVTPKNEFYTSDTTIVAGSPLITTAAGRVEGTFTIPDYKFADQTGAPRFKTGEIEFRLTMSDTNKRIGYGGVTVQTPSAGQSVYNAVGILETTTETITGTRNAKIIQTNVDEKTVIEDKGEISKETVDNRFVASNNSGNGGSVYHGAGDDYAGQGFVWDALAGRTGTSNRRPQPAIRSGLGIAPDAAGETTCFVAGTEIMMYDKSIKLIEDVIIGDKLIGLDGSINTVMKFDHPPLGNRKLYSFNKGKAFVTEEHPFMTIDGWKAINTDATLKEQPNLESEMIGNLEVGDRIVNHDGSYTHIESIEEHQDSPDRQLYNFELSGNNTYVADGMIVHNKKIVCTEMYRQTQLVNWQKAMKVWDIYQRRYLTPEHEIGYHWLFKPYVRGMQKSTVLTRLGAMLADRRTQHLKHILTKGKAKDDLIGNLWCKIIHPIVHITGRIISYFENAEKK